MTGHRAIKDSGLERRLFKSRLVIIAALVGAGLLGLVGRLAYLQVYAYEHFATLSEDNRVRLVPLPPPRGLIYDRNGVLLARNLPQYRLELVPEEIDDLGATLEQLRGLVDIRPVDIERFRSAVQRQQPFQGAPLRFNLGEQELARIAVNRHRFPGVAIKAHLGRHYPLARHGAHAVGYVGRLSEGDLARLDRRHYQGTSHVGKLGVERHYERRLHGEAGLEQVEVNAQGRRLRVLEREPPVPGEDIVLTLDARLQLVAETALDGRPGAVVAMDPGNGEVLALASIPSFDPNPFVNGLAERDYRALRDDPARPLFNRALAGQYPPGSTIKPVMALAGLEHGVVEPDERMFAGPYYRLPNRSRKYRDWKAGGHGWVDLGKAITQSCDVFFYDLAYRLGIDRMAAFLGRFGLGERTGIDVGGEASGLVPTREWKRGAHGEPWYPGETVIAGIGQGYMLTTPLQLATVAATLATRGERYRPHLLHAVTGSAGGEFEVVQPEALPPVGLSQDGHWQQVIEPMVGVMHEPNGTAYWTAGRDAAYEMAGKTGTAQVFGLEEGEEYDAEAIQRRLRDHALFLAFAPAQDPRIAVAVIVEHGGGGGSVAAPVARAVMDYYLLALDHWDGQARG